MSCVFVVLVHNDYFVGKGPLNPSRDEKLRQAPQKEGGEKSCVTRPSSYVTPAGASTSLTSRITGMTAHTYLRVSRLT